MAKILKLKNYQLVPITNWLSRLQLHGSESRFRTRFIKLCLDRIDEIDKTRIELCVKHQDKNAEGAPLFIDKEGKDTTDATKMISYKITDMTKLNEEYKPYQNEEFVFEIGPSNSETIYGVRQLILNTQEKFSGEQAPAYNEWCEAFESIA